MSRDPPGGSVLVIMPVASDPAHPARAAAIARGVRAAGLSTILPSYDAEDPRFDLEAFTDQLRSSVAVLADLTGERPSCYFELGCAEALGRPVSLFAAEGTTIHQSAHRNNTHFYRDLWELERQIADAFTGVGGTIAPPI